MLLSSEVEDQASDSIKLLYGIDESSPTEDKSQQFVPFIQEIRNDKLIGYLRFTIEKSYLTSSLSQNNTQSQTLFRVLLIVAGLIGFLATATRFDSSALAFARQAQVFARRPCRPYANPHSTIAYIALMRLGPLAVRCQAFCG